MAKTPVTLGIDLGGTKIDIGVVNDKGEILRRELIKTNKSGPDVVVDEICNAVKKLESPNESFLAAGVGMAGQIDGKSGFVYFAPNLKWTNFPLKNALENKIGCSVKVTNDVRAAALGEWLHGAGQGCNDLVCLFIGTGIGAGIVCGGKILEGCRNTAGEVGHMTLDLRGPICSCGNRGCFEALASGWAIAERAKECITHDSFMGKKFLDLTGKPIEEINARIVIEAYQAKSGLAIKVIEEAKEALIAGTANLVNAFNPSKIILGGGIITGAPFLVDVVREGISKRALKANVEVVEVVQAKLKGDAGVIGASALR